MKCRSTEAFWFADRGEADERRGVINNIGLAKVWGVSRSYDKIPEGHVALGAWGVLDVMTASTQTG